MVVCSCNEVDTNMIKECLSKNPMASPKEVMKSLGWEAECSICVHNMIQEINRKLEEIRNEK